jgi:hypothetical protein
MLMRQRWPQALRKTITQAILMTTRENLILASSSTFRRSSIAVSAFRAPDFCAEVAQFDVEIEHGAL